MDTTASQIPTTDYRRYDPFRTPEWRWLIALRHFDEHTRPGPREDPIIADLVRLLRCGGIDPAQAGSLSPSDLAAAHSVYSAATPLRDEIEARLLAGQPFDVIAAKTGIAASAVAAYERAFFDVASSLNAGGWINLAVLKLHPGVPVTEGQVWKCIGYACGPAILDQVIDDSYERPTTDKHRGGIAEKCRFMVRLEATNWSSPAAVRLIMAEARALLPNLFDPSRPNKNPLDALVFDVLEWRAPAEEQPAPAKTRKQKNYLTRPRRPKKGRRHGRREETQDSSTPCPAPDESRRSPAPAVVAAG